MLLKFIPLAPQPTIHFSLSLATFPSYLDPHNFTALTPPLPCRLPGSKRESGGLPLAFSYHHLPRSKRESEGFTPFF